MPSQINRIADAARRLRSLTQLDVQAQWRFTLSDMPIAQATQPNTWQSWQPVSLNAQRQITWAKGRRVMWLGQRVTVPHNLQGYFLQGLSLRLALTWWADLAQVYVNGQLVQEGDLFDPSARVLLRPSVTFQDGINVAIRLVSPDHANGAMVRSVCIYERADQSLNPPEPGFVADELTVLQEYLTAFSPNQLGLVANAVDRLPWSVLTVTDRNSFDRGLTALRQELNPLSEILKQRQVQMVGHAHLDLAWLWPVDETWEVAQNTFESVLGLKQDFPEMTFAHSTPALYAWIEANRPDLFAAIQQRITEGRWEVVSGMWIEPDLNLVSGESIARQILYGQRYEEEKFGQVNKIAWLPDTFGFSWQVPQLLTLGEVDYFVTQKLRWNDTTQVPHELYWWQAPDGSRTLSLNSAPIGEGVDPVRMANYAVTWEQKTSIPVSLWLPGVGDHGGGPTRDMLEIARRWQQSPFFPRLEFTTALDYLNQLNPNFPTPDFPLPTPSLPTWNSDLYLEFHRGCYTTHGDQKWWNNRCQEVLYEAELFSSIATLLLGTSYPQAALETAWKQVLFNQFHDILPGTSIPEVFVEANQEWETAERTGRTIRDRALQSLSERITLPQPPNPNARAITVFNSLNWQRSEVVTVTVEHTGFAGQACYWKICDLNGQTIESQLAFQNQNGTYHWQLSFLAENIPTLGYRSFWLCPSETGMRVPTVNNNPLTLENEFLRVSVDAAGNLSSVFDRVHRRELMSRGGNQLQSFRDQGEYWDAWNISPNYLQQPLPAPQVVSIQVEARGPISHRIRVIRRIGQSTFNQVYVLEKRSPLLKIQTQVNWQERRTLVKANFPLNMNSSHLTCEIPFGAIQRPTRRVTDREKAQWEVPALRWADLSDTASNDSYGFSLLSDTKHGYDCHPNQIRLSLLRGPEWPNPNADRGLHQFTYAVYPHDRDWRSAQTVQRGYELCQPLLAIVHPVPQGSRNLGNTNLPAEGQFLNLPGDNLILSAFKQSEGNANQWVIRCYESQGRSAQLARSVFGSGIIGQTLNPDSARSVNLLERSPAANQSSYAIEPWKIMTFLVNRRT
jgi:alpha-mannosidase